MQFIRHATITRNNALMVVIRGMSNTTKGPKVPRYTPQNQQILDDTMIPGPALRFFKTKREKKRHDHGNTDASIEQIYTTPARPISYNEFDSAPTVAQERLSERLQRAISTMYSTEVMPSQWVTLSHLQIRGVKVSRNLRKCQVLYEPSSSIKKERGNVHRALQDYTHLLNSMIRTHAHLKRPLSIKFVPDTQTKELEDIFKKISAEEDALYSLQN